MTRIWFVAEGPDSRHLQDCKEFNSLCEARVAYTRSLAPAVQLFSLDFEAWEPGKNKVVLKERVW